MVAPMFWPTSRPLLFPSSKWIPPCRRELPAASAASLRVSYSRSTGFPSPSPNGNVSSNLMTQGNSSDFENMLINSAAEDENVE